MTKTDAPFLGWHEARPLGTAAPVLLATLQAPRRNGAVVQVFSDGSLAYRFPPNLKWIPSRISVYSGVQRGRIGTGENVTPEEFVRRHVEELGYRRLAEPP